MSTPTLIRIKPTQCIVGADCNGLVPRCTNIAVWALDDKPLCFECMADMSDMNSDNAEVFAPALKEVHA